VIETRPVGEISEVRVKEVLESFHGEITQIPPMHSALKHQGQPLYKLAHQGIEVERKPRQVQIYELTLQRFEGDELEIRVHCSKGTYIRTLAEDIGEALGCGAHLSALRRTDVGPFHAEGMVTLDQLRAKVEGGSETLDAFLMPMEQALDGWPEVVLSDTTLYYVRQGQAVMVPQAPTHGWVRLFSPQREFIGAGVVLDDGRITPKRLFNLP